MKQPPDKYRTLKIPLKKILKINQNYAEMYDVINRTHKATIYVYQFLRAFILKQYDDTGEILLINDSVVSMAYRTIFTDSKRGPKLKTSNEIIFNRFKTFYNNEFKSLINSDSISGKYLSEIVMYSCTDIVKNIENNIMLNFIKYFQMYVNQCTKNIIKKELDKLKGDKKAEKEKELKKDLYEIKQNLLNNKPICVKNIFRKWADVNKSKILPTQFKTSIEHDIQIDPFKYLKYMLEMNRWLEKNKLKSFQFFPLRTNIIPKYIQIDTKSLVEIFIRKNKKQYLDKLTSFKDEIWGKYFKMDNSIFRQKGYTFDYCISTDGYCASIRFLKNTYAKENNKKKEKLKQGKLLAKRSYENLNEEEIEELKKVKEEKIKNKKSQNMLERKEKFKKMNKEDKDKIISESKEFKYIDKLKGDELEKVKRSKKIYVDPGMRSIFYMMDDENKVFDYTNKQRVKETKRLKYNRLIENYKKKNKISEEEDKLMKHNSKTCDYKKFKEYIKAKSEINNKLFVAYENEYFRKLKWFTFINTKRSEDNLLNKIEEKYGKEITIIIGDCCENNKNIKFMSTPNKSLKRKLKEKYPVYLIDEFRTSVLNHLTGERQENLYLADKKGTKRKIHSILTYKTETGRLGCINRDRNAVLNIKKLAKHYLETGKRLEKYQRGTPKKECRKRIQPLKDREMNSSPINSVKRITKKGALRNKSNNGNTDVNTS